LPDSTLPSYAWSFSRKEAVGGFFILIGRQ